MLLSAVLAALLTALALRGVANRDHPLSGEFLTSPFHGEILKRVTEVWDAHFGLGFSNLLNRPGSAPYTTAYGGAAWAVSDALGALFQWLGAAHYWNQVFNLFLLSLGVHCAFKFLHFPQLNGPPLAILSLSVTVIMHATDGLLTTVSSAANFPAGQGILLIVLVLCRRLIERELSGESTVSDLALLAAMLAAMLWVIPPYFLSAPLLISAQCFLEYVRSGDSRRRVVGCYAKIMLMCATVMLFTYGHVLIPCWMEPQSILVSGTVGRHDSPLPIPLAEMARFFNSPNSEHFGVLGVWLQSGLVLLGISIAGFQREMRRWLWVDILCILMFALLAKGSAPPFAAVNRWLHVNIPFLRMWGSSYPYVGVIHALAVYYVAYGVGRIFSLARKYSPCRGVTLASLATAIAVFVAVTRNGAYLSGDYAGRVQSIVYPTEYYVFKAVAESRMQTGRAYYFPDDGALIGVHYDYGPETSTASCYSLPFSSVFPVGAKWSNHNRNSGHYGQTMTFLLRHFEGGTELSHILARADTRYAVFDLTLRDNAPGLERMNTIRSQVRRSQAFVYRPALSNRCIEVYENLNWRPAASTQRRLTLSSADPSIFLEAAGEGGSEGQCVEVAAGDVTLREAMELKREGVLEGVLLYNSDGIGLTLEMIGSEYEITPDRNSLTTDDLNGWYTFNSVYQTSFIADYGGRFTGRHPIASAAHQAPAVYHGRVVSGTRYKLFAKAVVSPSSGRVTVNGSFGERALDLRSRGYVGLQWFDLGGLSFDGERARIVVVAQDEGRVKTIDRVVLIPETSLAEASVMLAELMAGCRTARVDRPGYLQWKETRAAGRPDGPPALDNTDIAAKRLVVTGQQFELIETFDVFGENLGRGLDVQSLLVSENRRHSDSETYFRYLYGGIHHSFIATTGKEAGSYVSRYELVSPRALSSLAMTLRTVSVTKESPVHFYVSGDGSHWERWATHVSDEQGSEPVDVSTFARNRNEVHLKIEYEKASRGSDSIYLLEIGVRGATKEEPMPRKEGGGWLPPVETEHSAMVGADGAESESGGGRRVIVIDRAFDPDWRMGKSTPFRVGYGFAAFLVDEDEEDLRLHHKWEYWYRVLLLVSLASFLGLCLAGVWIGYRYVWH